MTSIYKLRHQALGVLPYAFASAPTAEHVEAILRAPHVLVATAEEANARFGAGGPPWVMVVEEQLLAPGEAPQTILGASTGASATGASAAVPMVIISGTGVVS